MASNSLKLKISSDAEYNGSERRLALMVYKFFDKKSTSSGVKSTPNQQLPDELQKPIIRKFKTRLFFKNKSVLLLKTIFGV